MTDSRRYSTQTILLLLVIGFASSSHAGAVNSGVDFEFAPPEGRIRFSLAAAAIGDTPAWRLTVENDGARLPPRQSRQLFDSLVSHRAERGDTPHLGLGLYIVRLITEFHGGRVAAANSETLSGAAFSVTLPAAGAAR